MKILIYSSVLISALCSTNKIYSGAEEAFLSANTASYVADTATPHTATVGASGTGGSDAPVIDEDGISAKEEQMKQTPFKTTRILGLINGFLDTPSAVNLLKSGIIYLCYPL